MTKYPNVEQGIISRMEESRFGYHGWPSVCMDGDGIIYAVCSAYRMQHICPFGKTAMFISRDRGNTWEAPVIINNTPLDDRDAGIISLGGKKLLVTWFCHPTEVYLGQYRETIKDMCGENAWEAEEKMKGYSALSPEESRGGSFIRISEDGGSTWSKTIRVPVSSPHGPSLMADGRLLYFGKEFCSDELEEDILAVCESTDGGYTWKKLSEVDIPAGFTKDNFHEPHILELPSGRLMGAVRAQEAPAYHGFTIFLTYSNDKGKSFSPLKSLDVSGSPPHLMLHSSGKIICSFGRREFPFGERALVINEDGTGDEYILNEDGPDGDLGYPASVELPDKSILTVYYQKYPGDKKTSLLFSKWSLVEK